MQFRLGLNSKQAPIRVAAVTVATTFLLSTSAWAQSPAISTEAKMGHPIASVALLDGRQFNAGIVQADAEEDGTKPPLVDQLMFSNGKFSSAVCKRYNFTEAPYWVRVEGDQVHFLAELTSPTDGRMVWKGTVRGDTLEGTMRWTKERWYWTIDTEHKIRGQLEKGLNPASPNTK